MAMVDYATTGDTPTETKPRYSLINVGKDYADEFDYPVISIFNTKLKNLLVMMITSYDTGLFEKNRWNELKLDISFGTNEELSFSEPEVLALLNTSIELTDVQHAAAETFLGEVPSINIIDHIIDHFMYVRSNARTPNDRYVEVHSMPMLQQLYDFMEEEDAGQ